MRKNRSDAVHIMFTCKAFAENGCEVELVTPRVFRKEYKVEKNGIWKLYGIEPTFKIKELRTFILDHYRGVMPAAERIQKFIGFMIYFVVRLPSMNRCKTILYSKCYISILPAILLKRLGLLRSKIIFEKAEFFRHKRVHRFVCENIDGIVTINKFIKNHLTSDYKLAARKCFKKSYSSLPLNRYSEEIDIPRIRRKLGLDLDSKYVVYGGKVTINRRENLYLLEAAETLPDVKFILIGGVKETIDYYRGYCAKKNLKNVVFPGFLPLADFYDYLGASDILVSYYDAFDKAAIEQRVPGKMTIYLWMKKPIILADLPGTREWWSDKEVFFVPPDRSDLLAEKMKYILTNPKEAELKASACYRYAKTNSRKKCYGEILEFIKKL